jgi:transposase
VFQHEESDIKSFRMFTSQMIARGSVKPREIVATFGVAMVTVKRYMKVYRQQGAKGFYESKPRHSSASKLKGEVLERAQRSSTHDRTYAAHWLIWLLLRWPAYSGRRGRWFQNERKRHDHTKIHRRDLVSG